MIAVICTFPVLLRSSLSCKRGHHIRLLDFITAIWPFFCNMNMLARLISSLCIVQVLKPL